MRFAKRWMSLLLVVVLLLGMAPISAVAAGSLPFRDVTTQDWFYDEVCYVYENGMMNGTSETQFSPNAATTRGMIVTILHRLEGKPYAAPASFADVPVGQYYAQAVAWANERGIVEGYGNGQFGPNDNITREQLAAILFRYAKFCGHDTKGRTVLDQYRDAENVSDYAVDAMQWACHEKIINGTDGALAPQAFATRAQVAAMISRFAGDRGGMFIPTWGTGGNGGQDDDPSVDTDFDPKTDADRYITPTLYISNSDDEYIHFDEESGLTYYSNELIVYAVVGTDKAKIQSLVAKDDGIIVGMSGHTDSYQIRFPESLTKQELDNLKADYEASPYVDCVFFNLALDMEPSFSIPNTERWPSSFWEGDKISKYKNGNWGTLAINADHVWETLGDDMKPVRVGVFDGGCDVTHPELRNVVKGSSLAATNTDVINHGTHVAGTIAAEFDDTGICGICPTAELYIVDCDTANQKKTSSYYETFAYDYLLGENKCKVVNMSLATISYELCYGASHEDKNAISQLGKCTQALALSLGRLKKQNKDFLIVVCAGNGNGQWFFKDKSAPYGYYYVVFNEETEQYEYVDKDGITHSVEKRKLVSGGAIAQYESSLTYMSGNLSERIVVVGACTIKNSEYTQSYFSNTGSRVDIMAPGENIESCVSNNGYEKKWGTSMASPHVAGVAAMMFALDPDISAERVKEIIIETADTDVAGTDKNMVNAFGACAKVMQERDSGDKTVTGVVVDEATGEPIKNAVVSLYPEYDLSDPFATARTSETGEFVLETIPWVTYYLEISGCGYVKSFYLTSDTDLGTIYVSSTFTSITGKVVHAVTGEPMPEVRIQLLTEYGNYNTLVAKTQTDASGKFTLEAPVGIEYWIDFHVSDGYDNHDYFEHLGNTDLGTICIGPNTALVLRKTDGTPIELKDGTEVTAIAYEAIVSGEKAIVVVDPADGSGNVSQIIDTQLHREGEIVPASIRSKLRGPILLGYTEENIPVWRLGWQVNPDDFVLTNAEDPDFSISDNVLTWNEGDSTVQQWENIQLSENAKIWIVRPEKDEWIEELVPAEEFNAYRERYSLEPYPGYAWVVNDVLSGTGDSEYDYCYFVMIPVA